MKIQNSYAIKSFYLKAWIFISACKKLYPLFIITSLIAALLIFVDEPFAGFLMLTLGYSTWVFLAAVIFIRYARNINNYNEELTLETKLVSSRYFITLIKRLNNPNLLLRTGVLRNDNNLIELGIIKGANINAKTHGFTPWMLAKKLGFKEAILKVKFYGGGPDDKNYQEETNNGLVNILRDKNE